MRVLNQAIMAAMMCLPGTFSAFAGPIEDALIDKTIEAYGGERFHAMERLVIADHYKGFRFGQSNDPASVDEAVYDALISIDFKAKRKALQWVRGRKGAFSIQHQIFDGSKGYRLDHTDQTMSQDDGITYAGADRRVSYFLDTVLLKLLDATRDNAAYLGEAIYGGRLHQKISFQAEGYPKMTLYLDKESRLVSAMARDHWVAGQHYMYQFKDHGAVDGVVYAQDTYVTRGGLPFNVLLSRTVQVNSDIEAAFSIPQGYGEEGSALDFSDMQVKKLGDGVFLAGKGWGFSIFIDAGDYFVASGGYTGLKERFAAMKAYAGIEKPLKFQVVSHHHIDHLGGMKEAAELGATFITVKDHIASIRERAELPLADDRFLLVDTAGSFADGKIQVFDFPNAHASHHLVSYIPAVKAVFTADLFLSRQESGAPDGYEALIDLRDMLGNQNIDAEYFAAAHSGRVLTADDLATSIANIKPESCPANWTQCAHWIPDDR